MYKSVLFKLVMQIFLIQHFPKVFQFMDIVVKKVSFFADVNLKFINSSKGGKLLMWNEYTFYQKCRTWKIWTCCGKHKHKCEARLKMENESFVPVNLEHNHPPPKFHVTRDGTYIRI